MSTTRMSDLRAIEQEQSLENDLCCISEWDVDARLHTKTKEE